MNHALRWIWLAISNATIAPSNAPATYNRGRWPICSAISCESCCSNYRCDSRLDPLYHLFMNGRRGLMLKESGISSKPGKKQ